MVESVNAVLFGDVDNDGRSDDDEREDGTDPRDDDTDDDGVNDAIEVGGNVNTPIDSDNDGVIDALESNSNDADGDGLADQLDPANDDPCTPNAHHVACLAFDSDNDGLSNAEEAALGTNPDAADSDGDGINDAVEVGADAANPNDSDADGPTMTGSLIDDVNNGTLSSSGTIHSQPKLKS